MKLWISQGHGASFTITKNRKNSDVAKFNQFVDNASIDSRRSCQMFLEFSSIQKFQNNGQNEMWKCTCQV